MSKRKQSIIVGGLIGSAGIFACKILGILYVIPLNAWLGEDYMQYYSYAYKIYEYLINISIAGFPFAIATLVAKYSSTGDYQTALLVKKLSQGMMAAIGFVCMLFLFLFATPFAHILLPANASAQDVSITRNVLMIISLALFLVPLLSSTRGFYQGLKEMEIYAVNQIIEQITRVAFLLIMVALVVYVLPIDRVWAVYFSVFSTVASAGFAIYHLAAYDRKRIEEYVSLAQNQNVVSNNDKYSIMSELVRIALPYLGVALLGYSFTLLDSTFFNKAISYHYETYQGLSMVEAAKLSRTMYSMVFTNVAKLIAIPMMLAPGFSLAIIPYITTSLLNRNMKEVQKNILNCIDTVLYIGVFLSFCLFLYAKPIYYFMFKENADLGSQILMWYSLESFFSTITPIFTNLMMSLGMRKENLRNLFISTIVKACLFYPCMCYFGFKGTVISNGIAYLTILLLDIYYIKKHFDVKFTYTIRKCIFILISLFFMWAFTALLSLAGITGADVSRLHSFIYLAFAGIMSLVIYLASTSFFQLPQVIFNLDIRALLQKVKRRFIR